MKRAAALALCALLSFGVSPARAGAEHLLWGIPFGTNADAAREAAEADGVAEPTGERRVCGRCGVSVPEEDWEDHQRAHQEELSRRMERRVCGRCGVSVPEEDWEDHQRAHQEELSRQMERARVPIGHGPSRLSHGLIDSRSISVRGEEDQDGDGDDDGDA